MFNHVTAEKGPATGLLKRNIWGIAQNGSLAFFSGFVVQGVPARLLPYWTGSDVKFDVVHVWVDEDLFEKYLENLSKL